MNKLQAYGWATILSLPLVPYVLINVEAFSSNLMPRDVALAAPPVLQGFALYTVYKFTQGREHNHTAKEQQALWLLGLGIFLLLGVPILLTTLLGANDTGISDLGFTLMMLYAFAGLVLALRRIVSSGQTIHRYFFHRYLLPLTLMCVLTLIFIKFRIGINPVAIFYIFGNFSLASLNKQRLGQRANSV